MNEVAEAWFKVANKASLLVESLKLLRKQCEAQEKAWRETSGYIRNLHQDV